MNCCIRFACACEKAVALGDMHRVVTSVSCECSCRACRCSQKYMMKEKLCRDEHKITHTFPTVCSRFVHYHCWLCLQMTVHLLHGIQQVHVLLLASQQVQSILCFIDKLSSHTWCLQAAFNSYPPHNLVPAIYDVTVCFRGKEPSIMDLIDAQPSGADILIR